MFRVTFLIDLINKEREAVMKKVFVPSWTKVQFVAWADKRYPGHKHSKMKKKQLIAIFINS
jgi:hypothetical protein